MLFVVSVYCVFEGLLRPLNVTGRHIFSKRLHISFALALSFRELLGEFTVCTLSLNGILLFFLDLAPIILKDCVSIHTTKQA